MPCSYGLDEPVEGTWQERWGVRFKWTSKHLSPQQLKPLIHSFDTVAAEAVERLDEVGPPPSANSPPKDRIIEGVTISDQEKRPRRDLYKLMQEYASEDEKIGRLWSEVNTVPEWVDWDQIERGQKIFFRYGGPIFITLTFLSLLGGMGSARTVETLDRTGGFDAKAVRRRLLETTQHTLNVHRDLRSIQPGGDGFVNSVRVRLLHAAVRRRIMQMASQRPAYYDVASHGVPVSDLDCIGTIAVFSAAVVWVGLPRQGIRLRRREVTDYLALWRYVAYLMGVPHDWMATPESARAMMESLMLSEIRPSAASATLANNIITGLQDQAPTYASRQFMCAQTYWLNGRELSEKLEIDRPSLYYFSLILGQCLFLMATCYINRSVSWLDNRNINLVRKVFYTVLLEDKSKGALGYTTKFLFKRIPEFDKMSTERGVAVTGSGIRKPGIERMALLSLLAFSTLVGVGVWYSCKILTRLII
ncbi:putative tat pathway signal sequence [Rosellinia necatrix]|uniref:Putative tat pathway signal sequence n=1 Tax=Rosellinia necatrix TaxID=77044 RepID=A0A1S7UKF7_ROSNE|nr:putative tat pathway signal sequence [Rosellinia necatrix]